MTPKLVEDPTGVDPPKLVPQPTFLSDLRKHLDAIAQRHDAGHPSNAPTPGSKSYRFVPDGVPETNDPVVFVRHFLTERRTRESPTQLRIAFRAERAVFEPGLSTIFTNDIPATFQYLPDADGAFEPPATMPHEWGHALDLPDEYLEFAHANRAGVTLPKGFFYLMPPAPSFVGSEDERSVHRTLRPYVHDERGLMKLSGIPRIRYHWHHAQALNLNAALRQELDVERVVPVYSGSATTRYELPRLRDEVLDPSKHDTTSPWHPVKLESGAFRADSPGGPLLWRRALDGEVPLVRIGLYRVGPDESALGALLAGTHGTTAFAPPVDGVLIVEPRVRITSADPAISAVDTFMVASATWSTVKHPSLGPWLRVALEHPSPDAQTLARVAVLLQPRFITDTYDRETSTYKAMSEFFTLRLRPTPSHANPYAEVGGLTIPVAPAQVGAAPIRYALGLSTSAGGAVNVSLVQPHEIGASGLGTLLTTWLKDPSGTIRTVVTL